MAIEAVAARRVDESLIYRLRNLALSGDRRAIALQQKILEMNDIGAYRL